MGKKTYFPIMFLMEAITAYEFGFDLTAIFYAALSFEMALLIKVDEKIGDIKDEEKRKLKKLKNLIEKAYELQIIDEKHKAIAHTMRKLRNCYIHYYNAIHYLPVSSIPPKVIEKLKTLIEKNQKLMKAFESIDQKAIEITEVLKKGKPVCSWSISPEAIEFMKERYEEYFNWYVDELEKNPKQVINEIKHIGQINYPRRYDQKKFDALDMIKWDFEMLKHLKILS
jgi:translation initiation factor 2B subunit (eIF-2B alpha/beta/delta family)